MIEIIFIIMGLICLVKGKVNVTKKTAIKGKRVRALGILYLVELPFVILIARSGYLKNQDQVFSLGIGYLVFSIIITIAVIIFSLNKK